VYEEVNIIGLLTADDDIDELQLVTKIFVLQEHMKDVVNAYQQSGTLPPPSKPFTPSSTSHTQRYRYLPEFTVHGLT